VLRLPRGMPQYVERLATMLPAAAPDFDFVFFVNRQDPYLERGIDADAKLQQIAEPPNVSVIELASDGEMWWEQVLLPLYLRRVSADLLHMPTNRASLFSSVPQLVTIHDAMEWKHLKQVVRMPHGASFRIKTWVWRRRGYVYMNYALAMRRTKAIITVSDASAGDIVRFLHVDPVRVRTTHHGVDEDFTPARDPAMQMLTARQYCLMLGGDVFQKNPEGAVRLWAALSPELRARFPLVVIGFAGTDASPLIQAIRACGCEADVRILRWVPRQELIESMQRAAVLLFLSREEGFGLPVLQAMACGTPVAVSRAAAVQEVVGDAAAVSVDAEHPEEGSAGLTALLTDSDRWAERRAAAIRRAAEFSWNRCIESHIDVYRQCLHGRTAAV
jgi:glycosyltransferase involved in cell wall biosynthesis